jgi:spore coat protein F
LKPQNRLAWHETLDMHELVAYQTNGLVMLKHTINEVKDPALRHLYAQTIPILESNLRELLAFYPQAPMYQTREAKDPETAFYAGNLLGLAKNMVRNYAIAITETATPQLRDVLTKQINIAIQLHANVYRYMYERSYYPSYNLEQLLANDIKNAQLAMSL